MLLDRSGTLTALAALGDQLERIIDQPLEIVVCGGSALTALGLVDRSTRDVDILALIRSDAPNSLILLTADPLPSALVEAARIVGRDLSLPIDWLNSGPTGLLHEGLPEGFVDRLHRRAFGEKLVVHFISRFDQICLKTYAFINGSGMRHLSDLQSLKPTHSEMLLAARWSLTQDASEVFPELVRDFLRKIGYPDVADRL